MEQLYAILSEIRPDVEFRGTSGLVMERYIDSFDIVTILSYVEDAFHVEIPVESMVPENFDSAEAMMRLIESLRA